MQKSTSSVQKSFLRGLQRADRPTRQREALQNGPCQHQKHAQILISLE